MVRNRRQSGAVTVRGALFGPLGVLKSLKQQELPLRGFVFSGSPTGVQKKTEGSFLRS